MYKKYIIAGLAGALIASLVIFVTPLRHVAFVEPVMDSISPTEFYERYQLNPEDYIFIDVRSAKSYETEHAEGAINIPAANLFDEWRNLPKSDKTIALICAGNRLSGVSYGFLENHGFLNLLQIEGGTIQWIEEGLPTIKENKRAEQGAKGEQKSQIAHYQSKTCFL